ncbi:hypothetical protein ACGFYZ_06865 [Streptomyces sp. NPDC048330]|uniref:hypothetical protein n=1 Tax=Streptomyces sp. NPDC048330 TaxID=3365533 RepID=UPI00371A841A
MRGRPVLRIAGDSPRRRGEDRGRRAGDAVVRAWKVHEELFAAVAAAHGRAPDVRSLAPGCADTTRMWAPELVEETEGVADGAGVPFSASSPAPRSRPPR